MNGVLLTPNGNQRPIAFKRTARGRYLAELSEPLAGRNELRAKLSNDKLSPVAFHVSGELFGEKRGLGFDKAILQRIAELSGGIVNPTSTQIAGEQSEDIHKTDLSPWITILALLCFALGIWKAEETVSLTV